MSLYQLQSSVTVVGHLSRVVFGDLCVICMHPVSVPWLSFACVLTGATCPPRADVIPGTACMILRSALQTGIQDYELCASCLTSGDREDLFGR